MKNYKSIFTLLFISASLVLYICGCEKPKRYMYLIPEGYAGWLGVSYGITNAPVLEIEDGYQVIRFNNNGFFETSSPLIAGEGFDDKFYYYNGSKRCLVNIENELGGGFTSQKDIGTEKIIWQFWVSTNAKTDFEKYVKDKPVQYGQFKNYVPIK